MACQKWREFELAAKSTNKGFGAGSLCLPVLSFRHKERVEVVEDGGKLVEPLTPIGSCLADPSVEHEALAE